ncbi:MAG: ACP S-malonyltransferase [Anaerolineales bacterium]
MSTLQNTAFVFPGQGSQFLGMGLQLAQSYPIARATFAEADAILGIPLSKLAWDGPEAELNDTVNTQPALFVHSVAAWRVFQQTYPNLQPTYTAGHSLGQLSALVAAGALQFAEGLRLVRARGLAMKYAGSINPGGMAAILGLDIPTLEAVCAQASLPGEAVQVANDNCPGQVVLSGARPALERAVELAKKAGAKRAMLLAVSIAAHSELMQPAQEAFAVAIEKANIRDATIPIISNISAQPIQTAKDLRTELLAQLTQRVRWTDSIRFMLANSVDTFLEMGSGSVLTGLLKRIDREAQGIPLGLPADFFMLSIE